MSVWAMWSVVGPLALVLLGCAVVAEVWDARRGERSMVPTWCAVGSSVLLCAGAVVGAALYVP